MDLPSMLSAKHLNRRSFLKTAAAATGAATLGTSLAGCGSTNNSGTVTLQFWDWWVSQAAWVDNEIKLFQAAHPKITIKKTTNATATYDNLFNLAVKSNKQPDVFMITGTATPLNSQAQKGWLMPIDQWINDQWKSRFPTGTFHEGNNVFGGKTYTAPLSGNGPLLQLYINTAVFKAAGLTNSNGSVKIPKTWDDVSSYASTITKKSGGSVFGLGFGNSVPILNWWVDLFVRGAGSPSGAFGATGGGWMDGLDLRTGKYTLSSDRNYEDVIKMLLEWKQKGYIYPNSLSTSDEVSRVYFANGKYGMTIGGVWNQPGWTTRQFTDYQLTTLISPANTPRGYFYDTPGGQLYGISAKTRYPEEAWTWFNWLYSEEAGQRWVQQYNEDLSTFPSLNDPTKITFKPFAEYVGFSSAVLPGPDVGVHNPETSKVVFNSITPNLNDVLTGLFTGQLPDVKAALSDLESRAQSAHDKAISQAQASGAKVSATDWIFPDWDITRPYATRAK